MVCVPMEVGSERASDGSERAVSTARRVADALHSRAARCHDSGFSESRSFRAAAHDGVRPRATSWG